MRSIPYSRAGLVPRPRHPGRARAHRQRRRLPLPPLAHRLRPQPATPTLHPPLPATNQRQSRSPDQNTHPRVGLPLRLPNQHTPRQSPPQLPPLVQPTTTTQLPRRPTTNQPRLRPLWSVQVDSRRSPGPTAGPAVGDAFLRGEKLTLLFSWGKAHASPPRAPSSLLGGGALGSRDRGARKGSSLCTRR